MGHRVPGGGSWHRAGAGLGDASVGWVSGADALGPCQGVPRLHPKPCRKRSSSALLGIINGSVWGSQAKGKDINLDIKCCCSVRSPEPPYFAARSSWSPTSAPALVPRGAVGCVQPGSGRGRRPPGVLLCEVTGMRRGLGAFPRYCLVLTSPGQPLGAQLRSRGSWQCPAPPLQSKGPCSDSRSCAGAEGVFRVDETHAHTPPRRAHVMPQILKPYATLLFNITVLQGGEGIPSGRARALSRGPRAPSLPYAPKGIPDLRHCLRSPPSPAKPPFPPESPPSCVYCCKKLVKKIVLFVSNYSAICHNIYL